MLTKKYAIHPGQIFSIYDGDRHWISFSQLVTLYKINPQEAFIWNERTSRGKVEEDYQHLYPRRDGHYKL